jgi:hypothetical protein
MTWDELEEPTTGPVQEFCVGLIGGTAAIRGMPGSLLVYAGWLDATSVLLISAFAGVLIGGWMAVSCIRQRPRP